MAYMCLKCHNLGRTKVVDANGKRMDKCLRCGYVHKVDRREKKLTAELFLASLDARNRRNASK